MIWWQCFSVLGSMSVMASAGLAISVWLAAAGAWGLVLRWCWLFAGGMALVVLSKLAFIGWGIGLSSIGFTGFSGHAMRAAAVLPVAGFLVFKHAGAPARQGGVLAGVLLALLVSVARVAVHAHTPSEAISGCALGFAVAFAFIDQARPVREFVLNRALVALGIVALLWTPQFEAVPTEKWLTRLALHLSGHEQPFTRRDWTAAAHESVPQPGAMAVRAGALRAGISP